MKKKQSKTRQDLMKNKSIDLKLVNSMLNHSIHSLMDIFLFEETSNSENCTNLSRDVGERIAQCFTIHNYGDREMQKGRKRKMKSRTRQRIDEQVQ